MGADRERARMGSSNEELVAFMLSLRSPASVVTEVLSAPYRKPERRGESRFRWLCRRGWHSWVVLSVTHVRRVALAGGHSVSLGTISDRCGRCGFARVRYRAVVPKRVKT